MFAQKTHPFSLGGAALAVSLVLGLAAYDASDAVGFGGRHRAVRSHTPVTTYCCYQYRPVVIKRTYRRYYRVPTTSTVTTTSVPHHHHDGSHHHGSDHHGAHDHGSVQKSVEVDAHGHPVGHAPVAHSHQKPAVDDGAQSPFASSEKLPAIAEAADKLPMNAPTLEPPATE